MKKINFDLSNRKNDYKWNVAVLIHSIFLFIYFPLYINLEKKYEFYYNNIKFIFNSNREKNYSNSTNVIIYNNNRPANNNQKIKDLENEIEGLNKEIKKLTRNSIKISNERDDFKRKNEQLTKENLDLINSKRENEEDQKRIKDLEDIIVKKNKEISLLQENNINLLENMNEHKNVVNALKKSISFELNKDEKLMCIIFMSTDDQKIHYPIICKNKQKFNEVENLLYEKFPEYKDSENFFLIKGHKIIKSMTLEENNIENGEIITMAVFEENND